MAITVEKKYTDQVLRWIKIYENEQHIMSIIFYKNGNPLTIKHYKNKKLNGLTSHYDDKKSVTQYQIHKTGVLKFTLKNQNISLFENKSLVLLNSN